MVSDNSLKVLRSGIREMYDLAPKYGKTINLGIGEPSFQTPSHIVEAGIRALSDGYTKYTPNAGIPELRDCIAGEISKKLGLNVKRENVIVTNGAVEALLLVLLVNINRGDEVLIPSPSYPNFQNQVFLAGGSPVYVKTYENEKFHLTPHAILQAIGKSSKMIILNSPSNPTGSVLGKKELEEIAKVINEKSLAVISDETYSEIIFDGKQHFSIASLEETNQPVFIINSFSKTYAMTGWRVGYAIGPSDLISQMIKVQENVASCVSSASQYAALAAICGPKECISEMVKEYKERRDYLVEKLEQLPSLSCLFPEGGFYSFPNIKKTGFSSKTIAMEILEKAKVIVVPGSAFGEEGEGYLRVSFCGSKETICEGLARLSNFFENLTV